MKCTAGQVKKDYIWNTVAGITDAAEAVVMSMIVTRMTGLADAGVLSIAFAVGNQMAAVGKFGMRNYQATDVGNIFPFSVYLKSRIITTALMVISTSAYLLYGCLRLGYSSDKAGVIFVICMIYAVEAVEDVIRGYYQQRGCLYVGAKMFFYRWTGILAVFPFVLYFTRNMRLALQICFLLSVFVFGVLLKLTFHSVSGEKLSFATIRDGSLREAYRLLKNTFPLFGTTFLSFYVNNAPKYAIDAYLTDEMQACYGFVAMPVIIIDVINIFIYHPVLVPMAVEWRQGQIGRFMARIKRQLVIIAVISSACIAGAYGFGVPLLSLLYNTDLTDYKRELLILLLGGGFLAGSGYLSVVLTVMRCQKSLLWPYCLVSLAAFLGLNKIVCKYGTVGAAACYLFLMMLLCFIYGMLFVCKLNRKIKYEDC